VVESISLGVAVVMIVLYVLGLIYKLRHGAAEKIGEDAEDEPEQRWPLRTSIIVLVVTTLAVVWLSEILVASVEPVTHALGLSEFFIGIILIPIIGNVAEHLVAVEVSLKNKIELSLEIALSSSQQIALFVAPVLVFISLLLGQHLTLVFNTFELVALIAAVGISAMVALDGESNWLEGTQLLGVYIILGVAFFFVRG
jgi:Ca2+:H+ antiporter